MPVYDKEGNLVDVPADRDVQMQALQNKQVFLEVGKSYEMVFPGGQVQTVPYDDIGKAFTEYGGRLAGYDEARKAKLDVKHGGVAGAAKATVGGVGSALTLGLAQPFEEAQEARPGFAIAGEVAGTILPAFVPGGQATLLGKAAAKGATGAFKISEAAGRGARAVATQIAGSKAKTKTAQALLYGAQGAGETAPYIAGHLTREAFLREEGMSAEDVLSSAGAGVLFGGAAGTLMGAGAVTARGALQRLTKKSNKYVADAIKKEVGAEVADDTIQAVAAKLEAEGAGGYADAVEMLKEGDIDKFIDSLPFHKKMFVKLTDIMSDKGKDVAPFWGKDSQRKLFRAKYGKEEGDKIRGMLAKEMKDMRDLGIEASMPFRGKNLGQSVYKDLSGDFVPDSWGKVSTDIDEVLNGVENSLRAHIKSKDVAPEGKEEFKALLESVTRKRKKLKKHFVKTKGGEEIVDGNLAELNVELDDIKRSISNRRSVLQDELEGIADTTKGANPNYGDSVRKIAEVSDTFDNLLQMEAHFGRIANYRKSVNKATSQYLNLDQKLVRLMKDPYAVGTEGKSIVFKDSVIKQLSESLGDAKSKEKWNLFWQTYDARRGQLSAIEAAARKTDGTSVLSPANRKKITEFNDRFAPFAQEIANFSDILSTAKKFESLGGGTPAFAGTAGVLAAMGVGAVVGSEVSPEAKAASLFAGTLVAMAGNPKRMLSLRTHLYKMGQKSANRRAKMIQQFEGKPVAKAVRMAGTREVIRQKFLDQPDDKGPKPTNEGQWYKHHMQNAQRMLEDPTRYADKMSRAWGKEVNEAVPEMTNELLRSRIQAANIIMRELKADPYQHTQWAGGKFEWNPSTHDMHKMVQIIRVANDPNSVIEALMSGEYNSYMGDIYKELWPQHYDMSRNMVMDAVFDPKVNVQYNMRVQLANFFDFPEETLRNVLQRQQMYSSTRPPMLESGRPERQTQTGQAPSLSDKGQEKMTSMTKTTSQEIQGNRYD